MDGGIKIPSDVLLADTCDLAEARKRIIELEKELAHLRRESEMDEEQRRITIVGGLIKDEKYWRKRCMDIENKLGVLMVKHQDSMSAFHNDFRILKDIASKLAQSCDCLNLGDSVFDWIDNEMRKTREVEGEKNAGEKKNKH